MKKQHILFSLFQLGFVVIVLFSAGFLPRAVWAINCSSDAAIPLSGNSIAIDTSCSFPDSADGIDNGTGDAANTAVLSVASGVSLTVGGTNQTLATGSIDTRNSGSIIMLGTGQIKTGARIWMIDADNDGYPASSTQYVQATAPAGGKRRSAFTLFASKGAREYDFNDNDPSIYPGSNCNGVCGVALVNGTCGYRSSATVCRASTGTCDLAENCTGSSYACSADAGQGTGVVCGYGSYTASNGACQATRSRTFCAAADRSTCTGVSDTDPTPQSAPSNGQVWWNGSWQTGSSSIYCATSSVCSAGACSGTTYYDSCNTAGSCRTDHTGATTAPIYATAGNTFTAACASSTASACNTRQACRDNFYCNGSGACNTLTTNVAPGSDTYNDCTASYNACSGNYKIGPDGNCDGSGACNTGGLSTLCDTAGTCQTGGGCSAGSCVSVTNVANLTDPNNECTTTYTGCSNSTTKSGIGAYCNGAGACRTVTQACPTHYYCSAGSCYDGGYSCDAGIPLSNGTTCNTICATYYGHGCAGISYTNCPCCGPDPGNSCSNGGVGFPCFCYNY